MARTQDTAVPTARVGYMEEGGVLVLGKTSSLRMQRQERLPSCSVYQRGPRPNTRDIIISFYFFVVKLLSGKATSLPRARRQSRWKVQIPCDGVVGTVS